VDVDERLYTTTCIGRRSHLWHVFDLWAHRVKSLKAYTPPSATVDDVKICFSSTRRTTRSSPSRMNNCHTPTHIYVQPVWCSKGSSRYVQSFCTPIRREYAETP
jgi:hypothetical protein